jgi:hypothetical protein
MAKKISVDNTEILPAHHDGVAEIGHALDEADQEGVGQARLEQWQRDGHEGLLRRSARKRLRGLLQAGRHALHHAAHDHERDGREGEQVCATHTPSTSHRTSATA